jgi:phosphate starvation-inducible PhoH-like protein
MAKRKQQQQHHQHHQQQPHQQLRVVGGTDQSFRLARFACLTDAQRDAQDAWKEGLNVLLCGCAGTGKTYLSIYLALKEVMNQSTVYERVILVRSAVSSRDVGFLPGKLSDKLAVYETPYIGMLNTLFGRGDAFEVSKHRGLFEVVPTSFLRGMTLDRCIIVVDEMQNMNYEELHTVITRCGNDSRILFCGDEQQDDLHRNRFDVSGMKRFLSIIDQMASFEIVEFEPEDIVRGGIVKEFILAELALSRTAMKQIE